MIGQRETGVYVVLHMKPLRWLSAAICALVLPACAPSKPILYPNTHYQQVGEAGAEQDIAQCSDMAKEAGAKPGQGKAGQMAGGTVAGGAIGSAAGAVGGAVVGHAGRGAMIGAAGGAAGGLLRGLFRRSPPSEAYKQFVSRCLRERGYDPVGWE
jgi:uncharacterized protein YcfJ